MSAAVSLAFSKILVPEMQISKQKKAKDFKFADRYRTTIGKCLPPMSFRPESNMLECISNGAVHSAQFVWVIGANLLVFTALLALLNSIIGWCGDLIDIPDLTFNVRTR